MEKDFFELYKKIPRLCLEVGHSNITDWNIFIYDKTGKEGGDWGEPIIHIQDSGRLLVFSKAYAKLAEYALENRGGY